MTATASDSITMEMKGLVAEGMLRWLSLDDPVQCALWERIWESSAHRRPHDHPAYLELVRPKGYQAAAVVYRHGQAGMILYPFFHATVNDMPGFEGIRRPLRHLCSPYGYGGALYEGNPEQAAVAAAQFERLFGVELRERGFVTEFVREDIFNTRLARRSMGERVEHLPNVVIRLERDPDEIWRAYNHTLRTDVRRARSAELQFVVDRACERLDDFIRVYYETMERLNADSYFYMSRERFQHLCAALGRHRAVTLLHVHDGDEVVASAVALLSKDTVYGFLTASRRIANDKRPNHLMHHEAILWGRTNGYKYYVLGGGLSPNDGLFRFKSSFDPGSTLPFYLRKVIHNPHACQLLVDARRNRAHEAGSEWTPRPGYFPPYLA